MKLLMEMKESLTEGSHLIHTTTLANQMESSLFSVLIEESTDIRKKKMAGRTAKKKMKRGKTQT